MIKPRKELENVVPYQPGKPIEEVKRELGLKDVIKLASNENALGPSPKAVEAMKKELERVNRYPDGGSFYLKEALSSKFSVPKENIVLGNGSDEIIILALRAFVEPGDEVIVSDPTFLVYGIASAVIGAKKIVVPARDLKYDLEAMARSITAKTKMIFIANPDNPTGTYVSDKEFNAFLEKVPDNTIVFLDEAYYEFAKSEDYPETISYTKKNDKNVIVARTFSKAYSLAGLRIGYAFARKDIAEALNKIREPFNINSIAQAAAIAALEDETYLERSIGIVMEEKKKLYDELNKLDIKAVPGETNFILIDTRRDSIEIYNSLLKKGVIVREMSPWGLKGFIRVTVGLKKENERFIKTFKEVINNRVHS
ncbi:MAG: histidinol-phosphate transaminase [Candidatus Omnitrophota bacterium]